MKKVLFTTPVGEIPDYYESIMRRKIFGYRLPVPSFGLRFLKENLPSIEILEYPTWSRFEERVEKGGVEVLGISFYRKDLPVVKKMVKHARKQGVKEVYGGNYGVLSDEIDGWFDRVFVGYAEKKIAEELFGIKLRGIKHPNLTTTVSTPCLPFLRHKQGFLFTSRGCNLGCSFCQIPFFAPEREIIPIESIKEVLGEYKRNGLSFVFVMDENFITNGKHSHQVMDLLENFGFKWGCFLTRAEKSRGKVGELCEKGFTAAEVSIESFSQENLEWVGKKSSVDAVLELIEELREKNISVVGTFIIGYPEQKKKDIEEELDILCSLDLQACQITILTPFPHTPLWEELSEYGPFDADCSKYDCFHLVWKHPYVGRKEMEELLCRGYRKFYTRRRHLKNLIKPLKGSLGRGKF